MTEHTLLPSGVDEEEAAAKRVVRKIDLFLLPVLSFLYLLNYLDRSNLANVNHEISGDLSISKAQFGFASSVFQISYIVCEVPSNMLLRRSAHKAVFLCVLVVLFGATSLATAFVTSYAWLLVARVALGVAEAGFAPGVLFFLTLWYRPAELAYRNALFLVASSLANAVGALVARAILLLDGAGGLAGWRWVFLLEGLAAILAGAAGAAYLPDHPATCRWLSPDERALAVARTATTRRRAEANVPVEEAGGARHTLGEVVGLASSPLFWGFATINVCTNVASYGLGAFLPSIVADLFATHDACLGPANATAANVSSIITLTPAPSDPASTLQGNLLVAPIYAFQALVVIVASRASDWLGERGHVIAALLIASAVGMALLAFSVGLSWRPALQYAFCFCVVFYSAASPILLSWLAALYRGSGDAAFGPAAVLAIGSVGGFLGPNIYGLSGSDGCDLWGVSAGHFILAGFFLLGAVVALVLRVAVVVDIAGTGVEGKAKRAWHWRWQVLRNVASDRDPLLAAA